MDKEVEEYDPFISHSSSKQFLPELAKIRQALYRFFAALFLYPDIERIANIRATAEELLEVNFADGFPFEDTLIGLLEILSTLPTGDTQSIVNEYNRLYFVKPKAPLHESYYIDKEGQHRGWIIANLQGEYSNSGLVLSPTLNELPDHLSVELEYMSFLCSSQASAAENGTESESRRYQEMQRSFLTQHLAQWFPMFHKRVKDASQGAFYLAIIEALFDFLKWELQQ